MIGCGRVEPKSEQEEYTHLGMKKWLLAKIVSPPAALTARSQFSFLIFSSAMPVLITWQPAQTCRFLGNQNGEHNTHEAIKDVITK